MENKKKNAVKVCSVKPGEEPIMYETPNNRMLSVKELKKVTGFNKDRELIPARLFAR